MPSGCVSPASAAIPPAARAKVEQVASEILALGLDVDVVAGSSPQPIELYVPSYFGPSSSPSALGYVEQGWTTLGAAATVETGLAGSDLVLLLLALVAGVVFQGGVELLGLTRRAEDVAVLRGLGWERPRILRWFAAEALIGAVAILALTIGAWLISGGARAALAIGGILAAVTIGSALIGGMAAWRLSTPWSSRGSGIWLRAPRRNGRMTPFRLAVRNRLSRPLWTAIAAGTLGLGSASLVLAVVVLQSVVLRVGPTLLGSALAAELRPYQLAILGVTAVGLTALAALITRLDVVQRLPDFRVLWILGWSERRIGRVLAFERAIVGIGGGIIAALLTGLLAVATGNGPSAIVIGMAAVVALSVIVWGAAVSPTSTGARGG